MKRILFLLFLASCGVHGVAGEATPPMERLMMVRMVIDTTWGGDLVKLYGEVPTPREREDDEWGDGIRGPCNVPPEWDAVYSHIETFAYMLPWKTYNLTIERNHFGDTPSNILFEPPQGYEVLVNGMNIKGKMYFNDTRIPSLCLNFTVQIVPTMSSSKARAGVSTSLAPGKIAWSASLGEGILGDSIGSICIRNDGKGADWSQLPANLNLVLNTPEAYAIREPRLIQGNQIIEGKVVQVVSKDAILDVSYEGERISEIKFYHKSQTSTPLVGWETVSSFSPGYVYIGQTPNTDPPALPEYPYPQDFTTVSKCTFVGNPYVKYSFQPIVDENMNGLEVIKETFEPYSGNASSINGSVKQLRSSVFRGIAEDGSGAVEWVVNDWHEINGSPQVSARSRSVVNASGVREEEITILSPGNGGVDPVYKNKYINYPRLGEVLLEAERMGITTSYEYGTYLSNTTFANGTASPYDDPIYFPRTSAIRQSNGHVEVFEYDVGFYKNQETNYFDPRLFSKHIPFLNNVPVVTNGTLTQGNGMRVEYFHNPKYPVADRLPYGGERHFVYDSNTGNMVCVGQMTKDDDYLGVGYVNTYHKDGKILQYVEKPGTVGLGVCAYNRSQYEYYPTNKLIRRMYEFGVYNPPSEEESLGSFTKATWFGGGMPKKGIMETSETKTGMFETTTATKYIAGLSQKTVHIRDDYGHLRQIEEYVSTKNGTSSTTWALVRWELRDYNLANQLVRIKDSTGRVQTFAYEGELKVLEDDGNGKVTFYTYDSLGRVLSETASGIAGVTGNLTTRYVYNGTGDIVKKTLQGEGAEETITYECVYDEEGRKVREKTSGSGWISYEYDSANRKKTTRYPDDAYKVEEHFIDGRIKSITGNAIVNEFHNYSLSTKTGQSGFVVEEIRYGSPDSERVERITKDWMGRVVEKALPPVPDSNVERVESYIYHEGSGVKSSGLLLRKESTGLAPILYAYNEFGELKEEKARISSGNSGVDQGSRTTVVHKLSNSGLLYVESRTIRLPGGDLLGLVEDYIIGSNNQPITDANLRKWTARTDDNGHKTEEKVWVYPSEKKMVRVVTGQGINETRETYINGLLVKSVKPDGLEYRTEYDSLWRVSKSIDPRIGNTTTSYKSGTNLVEEVKDPEERLVGRNTYDEMGRVVRVENVFGKSVRTSYTSRGEVARVWGEATYPVSYEYDEHGVKIEMRTYRDEEGIDWGGEIWPGNAPEGDVTKWYYDAGSGLLLSKEDAKGKKVNFAYNDRGLVKTKQLGREVSAGVPLTISYAYYGDSSSDRKTAKIKTVSYNDGTPTLSYYYNDYVNVSRIHQAGVVGNKTFSYGNGTYPWRVTSEQVSNYLGSRIITFLYEAAGNTTVSGRAAGYKMGWADSRAGDMTQNYTYDLAGRVTSISSKVMSQDVRNYNYTYHAQAPLLSGMSISDSNYRVIREFDPHRNLITRQESGMALGATLLRNDYRHDDLGRRVRIQQQGAALADYGKPLLRVLGYTDRSEVQQDAAYLAETIDAELDPTTALPNRHYRYTYDGFGNRKSSNVNGETAGTETLYETNELNQYTSRENGVQVAGGTVNAEGKVVVDEEAAAQQESWWSRAIRPEANPAMKLLQIVAAVPGAVGETDRYYKESLRLLVPAMYQEYEYDADGNMISDGLYKYEYDGEDRLKAVYTHPLAVTYGVPYKRSDYVYDYMGRRIGKKETGVGGVFVKDTRYVYNGWNVQIEFSMSKSGGRTWSRTYSWGLDVSVSLTGAGGVGALLQVYDHIEKKTYLPVYDGNGNVMGMVDHGTGLLEAVYEYGPFGETIRATGGYAKKNTVRYSTKWTDDETGLVYYGRRYYSPELGRFINRDPIEEKGGLNLYGFCGNNGVNTYDVLGMRTSRVSKTGSSDDGDSGEYYEPGVDAWGNDGDFYEYDTQGYDEDAKICAALKGQTGKDYELKGTKTVKLADGKSVVVKTYGVAEQAKGQEEMNRVTPNVEVVTGTKTAVEVYTNTAGSGDNDKMVKVGEDKYVAMGNWVEEKKETNAPNGGGDQTVPQHIVDKYTAFINAPEKMSFDTIEEAHIAGALLAAVKGGASYTTDLLESIIGSASNRTLDKKLADTYSEHEYIWGIIGVGDGKFRPTGAITNRDSKRVDAKNNPEIMKAFADGTLRGIGHSHPGGGRMDHVMSGYGYGGIFDQKGGDRGVSAYFGVPIYMTDPWGGHRQGTSQMGSEDSMKADLRGAAFLNLIIKLRGK